MSDFLINKLSSSFSLSFSSSIIFCDSYNWKSFLLASYVVFWNGILLFQFNKKMNICWFNSIKKNSSCCFITMKDDGSWCCNLQWKNGAAGMKHGWYTTLCRYVWLGLEDQDQWQQIYMAAFSSLLGTFSLAVVIPFLLMGEHLFHSHQLNLLHLRKTSVRRNRFRRNTCIFILTLFWSHMDGRCITAFVDLQKSKFMPPPAFLIRRITSNARTFQP